MKSTASSEALKVNGNAMNNNLRSSTTTELIEIPLIDKTKSDIMKKYQNHNKGKTTMVTTSGNRGGPRNRSRLPTYPGIENNEPIPDSDIPNLPYRWFIHPIQNRFWTKFGPASKHQEHNRQNLPTMREQLESEQQYAGVKENSTNHTDLPATSTSNNNAPNSSSSSAANPKRRVKTTLTPKRGCWIYEMWNR